VLLRARGAVSNVCENIINLPLFHTRLVRFPNENATWVAKFKQQNWRSLSQPLLEQRMDRRREAG
jgi:hypothetical protein